jgi:hypothetical protein
MLKTSFALVLLILALSPFNAPFQTGGGTAQEQIAQIELLSAIRQDIDSRAVVEQRSTEPHGVVAVSPCESTFVILLSDRARILSSGSGGGCAFTGDYFPRAAVLRL